MTLPFVIFVALCPTLLAGARGSQERGRPQGDSLSEKVDSLFVRLSNNSSPGAAVLVVKDGKVLLRRGYGMANLEHQVPVTPSTIFDIASVSKQFTGMAISMLVEEGSISLNDDIRKYIPELPDFGHTITISHLLHHTSGIRDWPGTLALAGWRMDDVITFEQILRMAFHQQGLNFEPGSEYSYSNTGYNLLAEVVQRVSGKSFREWTNTHIFKPLGMDSTHFHDEYSEVVPGKAYGYVRDEGGKYQAVSNGLTALGSSSLYASINDLARWVMNFEDHQVGGKAVWERMLQQGVLNNGEQISYAFGLDVGEYRGLKTVNHSGGWAAFSTFLLHFPDQRFSVVVLMNHSPSDPAAASYRIADLYLEDALEPAESKPASKKAHEARNVAVSLLDEYTGTYRLGPAWYVTITREGEQLISKATAEQAVPMTARSDSTFWVQAYGSAIVFRRNKESRVNSLKYRGMICPKVEQAPSPDVEQLRELTGEYKSEELATFYTIVLEDGKLKLRHRRHGDIDLTPAWKDEFRGGAWFTQSVEFTRDEKGNVTGFLVSQQRSRNQRFVKEPAKTD